MEADMKNVKCVVTRMQKKKFLQQESINMVLIK